MFNYLEILRQRKHRERIIHRKEMKRKECKKKVYIILQKIGNVNSITNLRLNKIIIFNHGLERLTPSVNEFHL